MPNEYEAAVHCSILKKWWKSEGAVLPVCTGKTYEHAVTVSHSKQYNIV